MKRYVTSFFLVALLLGFTLLADEASAQQARRPGRFMDRGRLLMEKVLDLTPEQNEQLEALRKARREESWNFKDGMRKMRSEFRELMKDPEANGEKINFLIDQMAQLRANHTKGTIKHRQEVKKIFTPEQLEKIEEAKKKFSGRRTRGSRGFFRHGRQFRQGRFPSRQRLFRPKRRDWGFGNEDLDFNPDSLQ